MTRQYDSHGRDQINIESVQGNVMIQGREPPARTRTEALLLQAVKQEVESRLAQSLHNAVLINLGKQAQPEQVKRPWDAEVKIGSKPAQPLPSEVSILDVFDQTEIAGKLLILGDPGAGKTTTLLDLAKGLIERAETQTDYPIPVLFNLSSWKDPRQSMADWLVEELKSKYGVRKDIGKQWLAAKQLLPLLDGLDEVKPEHQEPCVQVINQWLQSESRPMYLVICSRQKEYATYATQLQLQGAICLQPLTDLQIRQYFAVVERADPLETISQDPTLLELVRTPLLLSITTLACIEISLENWLQQRTTKQRLQYLLDAYVQRMLHREIRDQAYKSHKSPSAKQTRYWLIFLAQQLQRESHTEFLIEKIQFDWVSNPTKLKVKIIQLSFLFLIVLGILWSSIRADFIKDHPMSSLETTLMTLITISMLFVLFFSRHFDFTRGASITYEIRWLWKKAILNFINSLAYGVVFGIAVGLMAGLSSYLELEKTNGVILGFGLGCLLGKVFFSKYTEILKALVELILFTLLEQIFERIKEDINIRLNFLVMTFNLIEKSIKFALKPIIWLSSYAFIIVSGIVLAIAGFWGSTQNTSFLSILREGAINGILLGLTAGFVYMCMTGWEEIKEIEPGSPNKGIKISLQHFAIVSTTIVLCFIFPSVAIYCFLQSLLSKQQVNEAFYYSLSASIGLLFGLVIGWQEAPIENATAFIRHSIVRFLLWQEGSIPWNYARFLDYCTERLLLQRVGGQYRFIHKLLQDHFAEMGE